MSLRHLVFTGLATVALSGTALAGNTAVILQNGAINSAGLTQRGVVNQGLILQHGGTNTAVASQRGFANNYLGVQVGPKNATGVAQTGFINRARVFQLP